MKTFVLLVTWIVSGQPPSSYQTTFNSAEACELARNAVLADGQRLRAEHAVNPGPQHQGGVRAHSLSGRYSITFRSANPASQLLIRSQNEQMLSALPPKAENRLRPQLMSSAEKIADAKLHRARYEPSRGRNFRAAMVQAREAVTVGRGRTRKSQSRMHGGPTCLRTLALESESGKPI